MKIKSTDQVLLEQAYENTYNSVAVTEGIMDLGKALLTDLMAWVPISRETAEHLFSKVEQDVQAKADPLLKKVMMQKLPAMRRELLSKEKITFGDFTQMVLNATK